MAKTKKSETIQLVSFDTPLESYKFGKPYLELFKRRGFTAVGHFLSTPPKQILFFEKNFNPEAYLYTYAALVLKVNEVHAPENKNFLILSGKDYSGHTYRVLTYQKTKWKNILWSLLAKKSEVTMIVYGLLRKDNSYFKNKADYFIEGQYIDLYSQKRIATPMYLSDFSDNEKLTKTAATLLEKVAFSDSLQPYLPGIYPDMGAMLRHLHQPTSLDEWYLAVQRYLIMALVYFYMRRDQSIPLLTEYETPPRPIHAQFDEQSAAGLPFQLSESQKTAVKNVLASLAQEKSTVHYVMGDVASGKSVVAYQSASSIVRASVEGKPARVVLLAPTIILATQHYRDFISYYPDLKEKTVLITGRTKVKDVDQFQVVIGTHALLTRPDMDADLLIIDEPQKFGIGQQKWKKPTHYLFLTATPLPRWTALLLANAIPCSEIEPRPRDVTLVPLAMSEEKLRLLLSKLPPDKPKMIVVPRISAEGVHMNLEEVKAVLDDMGIAYATVHGKMKDAEILDEMERFRNKEVSTLLATQMVETGLNIPELKYLVLIGAESYGNLNLYQLTGRVGRNGEQSFVYLMTYALDRMTNFAKTVKTGYDAAKLDLLQRGAGCMDETTQSGPIKIPLAERMTQDTIDASIQVYKELHKNAVDKEKVFSELSQFFDKYF